MNDTHSSDPRTPHAQDPAELLTRSGWIRGLARRLVRDEHLADDLAQDAEVAALTHPESASRSPRAWLATVLRNRAREAARRTERRTRREHGAATAGAAPPASDVVARAQLHATVVTAVLGLHEPYREVVLLRFFDDLPPRKIAKRLGVPVSTVHTRLTRAIDRLRVELDRHHGGDRTAWLGAAALLARPEATLGTGATVVAGAAAVLIGGAAAILGRDEPPEPTPPPVVAAATVAPAVEPREDEGGKDADDEPRPASMKVDDPEPLPPFERPAALPASIAPRSAATRPPAPPRPAGSTETASSSGPSDVRPSPVDRRRLDALRDVIADYFRARAEEDHRGMTRGFEKIRTFGDVAALPARDLRFVLSAPIFPDRRAPPRGRVLERSAEVSLSAGRTMDVRYLLSVPERRPGSKRLLEGNTEKTSPPCVLLLPPRGRSGALRAWFDETVPRALRDVAFVVAPDPARHGEPDVEWDSEEGRQRAFFAFADVSERFEVDRGRLFLDGAAEDVDPFVADLPTLFCGVLRRGGVGRAPARPRNDGFLHRYDLEGFDGGRDTDAFVARVEKRFAPTALDWRAAAVAQANAYWLSLSHPDQRFDPNRPLHVKASSDRATSTFHVAADPRILGYTLYLNDDLVDLDRPIRVVHSTLNADGTTADDARTVFEGTKERSLEFALQCWFLNLSGNLGEAYVDCVEIEL
ncbi:MAG: sigma-70 family RNA polymerase sigma factor [Planctomycetota bacterium JB042]